MTNKTIAVVANEKNEMHKSIFDDELFDDVTSYDSNELHCGIGISMEFSYYKDKGYIKKGFVSALTTASMNSRGYAYWVWEVRTVTSRDRTSSRRGRWQSGCASSSGS